MDNLDYFEKAKTVYQLYKTNKELQRKILIKDIISVVITVFWYYIWISSAIRHFSYSWATFNPKNIIMYIASFVILIIPFCIFKVHKVFDLIPKLYIVEKNIARAVKVDRVNIQELVTLYANRLDIRKRKKLNFHLYPGVLNRFSKGSVILLLKGIKYPVKVTLTDEEKTGEQVFCSYCGRFSPRHYERCFECSTILWDKDV